METDPPSDQGLLFSESHHDIQKLDEGRSLGLCETKQTRQRRSGMDEQDRRQVSSPPLSIGDDQRTDVGTAGLTRSLVALELARFSSGCHYIVRNVSVLNLLTNVQIANSIETGLAYNQMTNNLTSQSATMQLHGAPNDLINNLNPVTLVIFIPIVRSPHRARDHATKQCSRSTTLCTQPLGNTAFASRRSSVWHPASSSPAQQCWPPQSSSRLLQHHYAAHSLTTSRAQIYKTSPCPSSEVNSGGAACKSPINVWVQAVPYCLVAFSEVFTSVTGTYSTQIPTYCHNTDLLFVKVSSTPSPRLPRTCAVSSWV